MDFVKEERMNFHPLSFMEIKDIGDDLLLPWLDLYETSFSPREKMLVSVLLKMLKEKTEKATQNTFFLAATDVQDNLVGLALYEVSERCPVAYLIYLAVAGEARNRGVGSALYNEIIRRLSPLRLKAMLFEVERPDEVGTQEERTLAERRIRFYRRQGGFLMCGIHYLQDVSHNQPPMPMHIMVHPLMPCTPEEAFALAECLFGGNISRTGTITLE
jgi:ribosomal protein S18 acetylase RimI-like enzyme